DASKVQLTWFNREGQKVGTAGEPGPYANFSLAPDGKRIALDRTDQETIQRDIWVMDVERGSATRLTFNPADESSPRWSAAGRRRHLASMAPGRPRTVLPVEWEGHGRDYGERAGVQRGRSPRAVRGAEESDGGRRDRHRRSVRRGTRRPAVPVRADDAESFRA